MTFVDLVVAGVLIATVLVLVALHVTRKGA
jgi:hypothetical protein